MKLSYNIGCKEGSSSINNTPSLASQRLPFYTTSTGHYIANKDYFTEREGMENSHLLFYTASGQGILKYRGCERELEPGYAVIINCYEYQYYATASDAPWDFKWIHIGGAMAGEYEERVNMGSLSLIPLGMANKTDAALDSTLILLQDKADYLADVKICENITAMLTELVTCALKPIGAQSLHQQEMEAALRYIRSNYSRIDGIDEIAGCTNLSKYYFLRQFKAYTGLSPYEFLNNQRIDAAKQLLKEPGCKVGNTGLAVGFNDVNCFIRYFKKVTGVTPATYQRYYLY
jgi:AraC-like DNA-binding protein